MLHKAKAERINKEMIDIEIHIPEVSCKVKYKGFTIEVHNDQGDNPFMEYCSVQGHYPKVCIVPDGEYKWIATAFSIDCAKQFIDRWNSCE
jgi:hypothetical protein